MSTAPRLHYTHEEYLRLLAESAFKLEYREGVIYAMSGGTVAHSALSVAAIRKLADALEGRCKVFNSDLKVRVEASDLFTFPDVSVVCGELMTAKSDANAIVNPVLLVEVTSRSTEDYDRGDKLAHYQRLPSLRAVLFVSHRERRVTVVERVAGGWKERELRGGDRVVVHEPSLSLAVDELYEGVTLDAS